MDAQMTVVRGEAVILSTPITDRFTVDSHSRSNMVYAVDIYA